MGPPEPAWPAGWRWTMSGCSSSAITSGLFLAAAVYSLGYLASESKDEVTDVEEHFLFRNAPEAGFMGCMLLFLAAMTLVTVEPPFRTALDRRRSHDARQRSADLLPSASPLARSHLEVPADLLGRDRAGAAGQFLPRSVRGMSPATAALRSSSTSCCRRARSAEPGLAEGCVRPHAGRLRHEDGAAPRCTRGSPMRTAKRRRWCRRCCPVPC